MRFVAATLMAALVAGCAIKPVTHIAASAAPAGQRCAFNRHIIDVPDPTTPPAADTSLREADSAIATAIDANGRMSGGRPVDSAMLFLSGGSQHGAFGAGYLTGLKEGSPSHHLPNYSVVTGVSTGALISTFAFIDRPDIAARLYRIDSESQLLTPLVGVHDGKPSKTGAVFLLKKGAIADLAPLRKKLSDALTPDILEAVAEGARTRVLRVGVVDVDLGAAVSLDLGAMAIQWHDQTDSGMRDFYKSCYVEAILASSSAPLAALPVFIDNRMYVDGGLRFGAFTDEVGRVLDDSSKMLPVRPQIYLIFNGYQRLGSTCGRADKARCLPDNRDPETLDADHADWGFIDMALQSEEIVANQIYRLSAINVAYSAKVRNLPPPWFAKIDADATTFVPADHGGNDPLSCAAAKAFDSTPKRPVQFYARYMRCIVAYGLWRGKEEAAQGHPRTSSDQI